jgi:hypothetical protein
MQKERLEMSVPIIFACLVVLVVWPGGRQLLQPFANILNQSTFVIIHVNGGGYVHRRNKAQTVLHSAALDDLLHLVSNVHHLAALSGFKDQILGVAFHTRLLAAGFVSGGADAQALS